ncbi:hypothetical protein [Kineococcus sp. G2]|uniref:hypothetical protein n=1 Tax=Kineococcus sp. G2 TaxID=3127484 RepID=UPI00301D9191
MLSRRTFVAGVTGGSAVSAVPPAAATPAPAGPPGAAAPALDPFRGPDVDRPFVDRALRAAEAAAPGVLEGYRTQIEGLWPYRAVARSALRLAALHVSPRSAFHADAGLAAAITEMAAALRADQHRDGTFDVGNLHTPPDTAFVVRDLCELLTLLRAAAPQRGPDPLRAARDDLTAVLTAAGRAMATGGVHTPNHRWEVSAALAQTDLLLPDPAHRRRVEEWLAEGVDVDGDGQYSERSPNYAFAVTNPSLLAIARCTGRVDLRAVVRRNLDLQLVLAEDDGAVESVQSRRQDQGQRKDLADGLLQFREMALRDGDGRYAAVVQELLARTDDAARYGDADLWAQLLVHPDLAARLPRPRPWRVDGTRVLAGSGLARLRAGDCTATVYAGTDGGEDEDRPGPIASGLATNPTFLRYRRGAAVLSSVRFSPRFFSTGHFRGRGLEPLADSAFRTSQRITAGYYQPLPPGRRRPDGDYDLTGEGRFWAAMSFDERVRDERVLETTVVVRPVAGDLRRGFDVEFAVGGTEEDGDVPAVVELAFAGEGELEGTVVLQEAADGAPAVHQLVEGWGTWRSGGDEVHFGPGTGSGPRQPPVVDPGERYTWLGGDLVPSGTRVLLTTTVPRRWTLSLR